MNIQPGELRFAWVLLFLLALMAFPWVSRPGPIVLITAAIGFLPGALILASRTRTMRMAGEVENLLATSIGRISVALGLAIAALIAVIFDVFVATFLVALTTEIMWLVLLVSPTSSLPRFFPGGMLAAGTTLILLIATDTTLNWGPVARRLGTPSERARWKEHYARAKQKNLFQFRSPYEDTRRRRGVRRIIALGDSFTEGFGIWSSDSTWPAQLERELNRGLDSASTEVLNMGRSGFTTGSEAELLRRLGWQFDPDLVIVQWLSNDISPTCPNLRICGAAVHVTLVPARFRTGLIQGSAILFLLERYLSAVLNPTPVELYVPASSQWHALQAALKEMVDSAAQRCVPLMFVAYPYLFPGRWTSATYPERQLMDLVIEDARRDGAEVLDLLPTFVEANRPGESWWAAPYDPHPSAAANHLAIVSMARFIRERNLLPDRRDKDTRAKTPCKPAAKPVILQP